jgi:hypothetical protein
METPLVASEKLAQRVTQPGKMPLDNQPHTRVIYLRISMHQDITEGDYARKIRNELRSSLVDSRQPGESFTDDLELPAQPPI